jgi:ribosomal protein L33
MIRKKYAYCKNCKKHIEKPKRKKLTSYHYQILIIASIASLGFGLVAFILYRLIIQRKKYCSGCRKEVKFYESQEDFPKKVPVKHLQARLEKKRKKRKQKETQEKEEKQEKKDLEEKAESSEESEFLVDEGHIICSFCGEEIEESLKICPYCGKEQI